MSSLAWGTTSRFSVLFYRPASGPSDYLMTFGSETLPQNKWLFSTQFDYGYHPLELTLNGNRNQGVVDHLFIQHFTGSYAPVGGIQFDVDLPLVWLERFVSPTAATPSSTSVTSVGEIFLRARLRFWDGKKHFLGFTLAPFATIPTGKANHFLSDHKPTVGIMAAVDKNFGDRVSFGLNVSVDGREHVVFHDLQTSSRFWLSAGGRVKVGKSFQIKGDITTHSSATHAFQNIVSSPVEFLTGADYQLGKTNWKVNVGSGFSIVRAAGEPLFRTLAGISYTVK